MGMGALALQGAGVGMSMMGAMNQGEAQKQALGYESTVASNNAIVASYQADVAKEVGAQQTQASEFKTSALYGEQRAQLAANGVDLGTGSATDVLASTKYMGMRDVMTIQDNTNRQVWADQVAASGFKGEAAADAAAGRQINPGLMGATTLLTGAGSTLNTYAALKRAGSI